MERREFLLGFAASGAVTTTRSAMAGPSDRPASQAITSVETLAALRVAGPPRSAVVFVEGHTSPTDGGGGFFRWVADDTRPDNNASVVAPDPGSPGRWERVPDGATLNVRAFGAVADGHYDAGYLGTGGYAGTDNTAAFQAAIDAASAVKGTVYVPAGPYTFFRQAGHFTHCISMPSWVNVVGEPGADLLIDEDPTEKLRGNKDGWLFAHTSLSSHWDDREFCSFEGVTFRGLWSYHKTGNHKMGPVLPRNCSNVLFYKCQFYDINSPAVLGELNGSFYAISCDLERIAGSGLHSRGTRDYRIIGCNFRHMGDDPIDCHSNSKYPGVNDRPVRYSQIALGNTLEDTGGITMIGAHHCVVTNNTVQRCRDGIVVQGLGQAEGENAQTHLVIANNVVSDSLMEWDYENGDWASSIEVNYRHIAIGGCTFSQGTTGAYPGFYDSGSATVVAPEGSPGSTPSWGYMWANNTVDNSWGTGSNSSFGSQNIIVANNVVGNTLPNDVNYTDWGFGQMFTMSGWLDPPITSGARAKSGVCIVSDLWNALIVGNAFSGLINGLYFYEIRNSTNRDTQFRNISITNNNFTDVRQCITSSRRGRNSKRKSWDIAIAGNRFDCDPYIKDKSRKHVSGTWIATKSRRDIPCGVNLNGISGVRVERNTFSNCYTPVVPDWGSAAAVAQYMPVDNVLQCDPAGLNYWADNRGIADLPAAGVGWRYEIWNCDPTSPDFRKFINFCVLQSRSMPTSGTYVHGHYVHRDSPVVSDGRLLMGWMRLTTGDRHVLGTDWAEVFAGVGR